jgi:hypothetical protein
MLIDLIKKNKSTSTQPKKSNKKQRWTSSNAEKFGFYSFPIFQVLIDYIAQQCP